MREFGGQVELIDVGVKSRADRVAELAKEHPEAYIASAYDDPHVILTFQNWTPGFDHR